MWKRQYLAVVSIVKGKSPSQKVEWQNTLRQTFSSSVGKMDVVFRSAFKPFCPACFLVLLHVTQLLLTLGGWTIKSYYQGRFLCCNIPFISLTAPKLHAEPQSLRLEPPMLTFQFRLKMCFYCISLSHSHILLEFWKLIFWGPHTTYHTWGSTLEQSWTTQTLIRWWLQLLC